MEIGGGKKVSVELQRGAGSLGDWRLVCVDWLRFTATTTLEYDVIVTMQSSRRCGLKTASSSASKSMAAFRARSFHRVRLLSHGLCTRASRRRRVRSRQPCALGIVLAVVLQFVASVARARSTLLGTRLAVGAEGGSGGCSHVLRGRGQRGKAVFTLLASILGSLASRLASPALRWSHIYSVDALLTLSARRSPAVSARAIISQRVARTRIHLAKLMVCRVCVAVI